MSCCWTTAARALLGTEFEDMLRCIRCGACLDHCPVYQKVGGHAYGWVYSGPMGAVLTPGLLGIEKATPLPNASTFCGRCESVCPMRIPLAQDDAPLARARVRAPSDAVAISRRAWRSGASSPAVRGSIAWPIGPGRAVPGRARAPARRLPLLAAGGRLDGLSRHAGTGGPQLPRALGRARRR